MHRQRFYTGVVTGLMVLAVVCSASVANAQEPISTSNNYQMIDSGFEGTAGSTGCSGSYCAQSGMESGGETPILEVSVSSGDSELTQLSVDKVATKEASITVKNYLSYGYTVQIVGDVPKYDSHTIATSATPVAIQAGVEYFGINLVENTSLDVGKNPVQSPTDGTVFGTVADNYNQVDKFAYTSGDTVARGESTMQEVGQTTYTLSMAMAISNVTPAGQYATDLSVVVVPVY